MLWRSGRPTPTAGVGLTLAGLMAMAFVIWSMTVTGAAERNGLWSQSEHEALDLGNSTPEATATPSIDTSWLPTSAGEPLGEPSGPPPQRLPKLGSWVGPAVPFARSAFIGESLRHT